MHFHLTESQAVRELVMFYFEDGHGNSVDNPNQTLDIESLCLAFEISPLQLVDLLNNDSVQPRLRTSEETKVKAWIKRHNLYGAEGIEYFTQEMVNQDIIIHYEEIYSWVTFHPELFMPEEIGQPEDKTQSRITELEAENEHLKAKIAEFESTVQAGGEGEVTFHEEDFPAEYENHGIFTVVAKLVDARTPVADIMAALDDEKNFLSQRENGYFFHPDPEGKSASTLRNYTKNTLKKRIANG